MKRRESELRKRIKLREEEEDRKEREIGGGRTLRIRTGEWDNMEEEKKGNKITENEENGKGRNRE